jgi:hypothetical protein
MLLEMMDAKVEEVVVEVLEVNKTHNIDKI